MSARFKDDVPSNEKVASSSTHSHSVATDNDRGPTITETAIMDSSPRAEGSDENRRLSEMSRMQLEPVSVAVNHHFSVSVPPELSPRNSESSSIGSRLVLPVAPAQDQPGPPTTTTTTSLEPLNVPASEVLESQPSTASGYEWNERHVNLTSKGNDGYASLSIRPDGQGYLGELGCQQTYMQRHLTKVV